LQYLALFASALSGVFMALQGVFNSRLSEKVGLFRSNLYLHGIALGLAFILYLFAPHPVIREKLTFVDFLGGFLAPAIILLVAYGIARSGAFYATVAIVAAQTLSAALLDNLGLFGLEKRPFTFTEFLGGVLIVVGVYLVLKIK